MCHRLLHSLLASTYLTQLSVHAAFGDDPTHALHACTLLPAFAATVGTRIDLVGQLRDREMHQEEYSESIAFLRFANQLLEEVGLPDASKVPEYTQFVVNHIMQNNWSRQYR
jgi:hypothetical protein